MAVCPNCGNTTGEGAVFCDQCGTRLPQPEAAQAPAEAQPAGPAAGPGPAPAGGAVICPACGAGNVPGEAFCDFCGSPLEAPEPAVEAVAEQPAEAQAAPESPAPAEEPPAPPAAAEEAAPSVEAAMAAGPDPSTCPVCGAAVEPDEAFCATCGASLAQAPIPPEPVDEAEAVEVPVPPQPTSPAPVAPEPAPELQAALEAATPPPAAPAEPAPAEPGAGEAALTCPACGTAIEPGDAFCSACGFALQAVTTPPQAPAAPEPPAKPSAVGSRLVISASGAEIPLPDKDEILVGREDPVSGIYPDVDLTPHGGEEGGVSRRHARLIKEGDTYYVEDLDSTNFTFVNKQKLAPKTRHVIDEGDEIRFGRVAVELRTG